MQLKPEVPLTPALSPEERENVSNAADWLKIQGLSQRGDKRLPLPGGEGWGEGEPFITLHCSV